jgi:shikimate kinase
MKTSLALIGFMGVGKSAAGKKLAGRLGKRFVEADSWIEQKAGKSISWIFREEGEIGFREIEIEVIKEIASSENQVIACGGGVVLNQINIDRLRRNALIVWLTAAAEVILRRTSLDEERPLLKGKREESDILAMIKQREPFYERAADIRIDTSDIDLESVVEKILDEVKRNADFSP